MSKLDFASLLCSRLCHDLVSPVGAINNGLELLTSEKDENMRAAVLDLIEKSTAQTSNKLQFFRLAFGAAGGFSTYLDTREAASSLQAFLAGSRVELSWDVEVPELTKGGVKLLLNLCLISSEALIRGGQLFVHFHQAENGMLDLKIEGKGERVILSSTVRSALAGEILEEELEPRAAPAYLARLVAGELGGTVTLKEVTDKQLIITAAIRAQAE